MMTAIEVTWDHLGQAAGAVSGNLQCPVPDAGCSYSTDTLSVSLKVCVILDIVSSYLDLSLILLLSG